jgi:hypothetical protein
VALARGHDAAAQRWLQSALAKPQWTLYEREVRLARLHVLQAAELVGLWRFVGVQSEPSAFPANARIRALVKQIAARADALRKAGKHSEAIAWYWAGFRIGYLQVSQGDSILEAFTGKACAAIATAPFLSTQERQTISSRFPFPPRQEAPRLRRALDEANARNFQAYLRRNGRADLAEVHRRETARIQRTYQRMRDHIGAGKPLLEMMAATIPVVVGGEVFTAMVGLFAAWGMAGFLWPILRKSAAGKPTGWGWGTWLAIFVVSLSPLAVVISVLPPVGRATMSLWTWAPPLVLSGGLALFVILTLVTMIVRRRRARGEAIGGFSDFMHSLVVLLPPAIAGLFVIFVLSLPPADRASQRLVSQYVQVIRQGEMAYYHLR